MSDSPPSDREPVIERKAAEMYRAENPKAASSFDELPKYARQIYREAAAAALERELAGGRPEEESKD